MNKAQIPNLQAFLDWIKDYPGDFHIDKMLNGQVKVSFPNGPDNWSKEERDYLDTYPTASTIRRRNGWNGCWVTFAVPFMIKWEPADNADR